MKLKRLCRTAVCLLLVCVLIFNVAAMEARATGLEAAAAIASASTVTVSAPLVIGATLITLGLYAATDPEGFRNLQTAAVNALESVGVWVNNATVQLLRTVDSAGNARYYVDSGLVESVRNWVCDEEIVLTTGPISSGPYIGSYISPAFLDYLEICYSHPYYFVSYSTFNHYWYAGYSDTSPFEIIYQDNKSSYTIYTPDGSTFKYYTSTASSTGGGRAYSLDYMTDVNPSIPAISTQDIAVGNFPVFSVDGTSARYWSEEYTDSGLKVYSGGSGNNNDGKWFWKLILPTTAATLLAMSQADAWGGDTSNEFSDYEIETVLKVIDTPEVEFGYGVEFEEVSGGIGSGSGTISGTISLPGWVQDGMNNLLQGLKDISSGILSLPSAIAMALWAALPAWIQDGILNMVTGLQDIWDSIKALPVAIAEALAAVFAPSADYISVKVDALRGEFGFIDSVIATGEFIRDSVSGASGPPVIYVDLGRASSGNYGSQRVLLTDFSWYAPYKGQVDTVLSAALWAFFGWRVFLKLPGIIGGESGYISDVFFPSSSGRSGSDDKKKGGKG